MTQPKPRQGNRSALPCQSASPCSAGIIATDPCTRVPAPREKEVRGALREVQASTRGSAGRPNQGVGSPCSTIYPPSTRRATFPPHRTQVPCNTRSPCSTDAPVKAMDVLLPHVVHHTVFRIRSFDRGGTRSHARSASGVNGDGGAPDGPREREDRLSQGDPCQFDMYPWSLQTGQYHSISPVAWLIAAWILPPQGRRPGRLRQGTSRACVPPSARAELWATIAPRNRTMGRGLSGTRPDASRKCVMSEINAPRIIPPSCSVRPTNDLRVRPRRTAKASQILKTAGPQGNARVHAPRAPCQHPGPRYL